MAFSASSGQIVVTDTDTHVVFDSNEKLFNGTDYVSGSITFPERYGLIGSSGYIHFDNIDADTSLASVNANADTVIGAFSASSTVGSIGVTGLGWFSATGTYLHYLDALGPGTRPVDKRYPGQIASYTFYASGGTLYVNERTYITAPFYTLSGSTTYRLSIGSITLNYKLYVGTFT